MRSSPGSGVVGPWVSLLSLLPLFLAADLARGVEGLGVFEAQADVGKVQQAGSASFDSGDGSYLVAGGGENMWFTNDAFHFVWTRVAGDFTLSAAVEWLGESAQPHRKACPR